MYPTTKLKEKEMKKLFLLFALGVTASAQTPTTKYLVLGADPQAKDRQPLASEEVVVIDHDLCDSGWGTGTAGKKVAGCYPKNSAVIRDKTTLLVTAMFVCGNTPNDEHKVTGKVVVAEVAPRPTPAPATLAVTGIPDEIQVDVVHNGEVRHVHAGVVEVHHSGTVTLAPLPVPRPVVDKKGGHHGLWWKIGIPVGAGIAAGIVAGTRGHKQPATPPTPPSPPRTVTGGSF